MVRAKRRSMASRLDFRLGTTSYGEGPGNDALGAKPGPCKGGRRTPPSRTTVVCVKGHNIRVSAVNAAALIRAHKATKGFCKKS